MSKAAPKLDDHPVAQIFPMMNAADKITLSDSIVANGLREEIILLEGKIIDGRNRYEACLFRGVAPRFREYDFAKDGPSPTQFVLDKNLTRRHLTPSQLAAIGAEAMPFFQAEAKERQRHGVQTGTADFIRGAGHTGDTPSKGPGAPAGVDEFSQETGHDPAEESQTPARQKKHATHRKPAVRSTTATPRKKTATTGKSGATPATKAAKPKAEAAPAAPDPKPPAQSSPTKAGATPGKARDQAAATVGVSGSLVGQAAAIKKEAPATFEKVKAGEMSVTAAKATLNASKKKAAEYDEALARVESVAGKALIDAMKDGKVLHGRREVIAYAALTDDEMIAARGLIADGWTVAKAKAYKAQSLGRTHRIGDLITRAAAAGGMFTIEIAPFRITVQHRDLIQ